MRVIGGSHKGRTLKGPSTQDVRPTSDRLREAGWNVTEASTIAAADVMATTVYFGAAEGEQAAADAVAAVLEAPVAPRIPEIAEQPPGVIVLVTG